jgi:hypothetical protein
MISTIKKRLTKKEIVENINNHSKAFLGDLINILNYETEALNKRKKRSSVKSKKKNNRKK